MKVKAKAGLLLASALMATSVAGCNQEIVDNGNVIIVWTTFNDDYGAIINKAIKNMKKKYPEYTVRYKKQSGGYNELKDMVVKGIAVGSYPDVTVAYPDSVTSFLDTGKGLNITPYMENEEYGWTEDDLDDIPEAYIEEGQKYAYEGTYSLPICKSTEALFYNRSILVGLDLSSVNDEINDGRPLDDEYFSNLTWEELFGKLCPAIAEYDSKLAADKKIITYPSKYTNNGAIVGYDSDDNFFITLAEQYGLPFTQINQQTGRGSAEFVIKENGAFKDVSPEYLQLMEMIMGATQDHKFGETNYKYLTTSAVLGARTNTVFTGKNGGMLFSIGSTGGTKYQDASSGGKQDVGVTFLPTAEGAKRKAINQGPSVAFLKRGKNEQQEDMHAKGAWLFYKEWTSAELGTSWATVTGYAPIRRSVANSKEYIAYSSTEGKTAGSTAILQARNAKLVADNIDNLFSSPVYSKSGKAREAVKAIFADLSKEDAKVPFDEGTAGYTTKLEAFHNAVRKVFKKAFEAAIK